MILLCLAALAIDGDTLRCADGLRVRLQGVEANEMHRPGCHLPVCPAMPGPEAKAAMQRLIGGKDLYCEPTGRSHRRLTAWCTLPNGRDLSCETILYGITVRWEKFDRGGRLKGCDLGAMRSNYIDSAIHYRSGL